MEQHSSTCRLATGSSSEYMLAIRQQNLLVSQRKRRKTSSDGGYCLQSAVTFCRDRRRTQKQNGPPPKSGLDLKSAGSRHTPRGEEKVYLCNEAF